MMFSFTDFVGIFQDLKFSALLPAVFRLITHHLIQRLMTSKRMLHNNYNSVMLIQAFEDYERCSSLKDYCYGERCRFDFSTGGDTMSGALFNTHT